MHAGHVALFFVILFITIDCAASSFVSKLFRSKSKKDKSSSSRHDNNNDFAPAMPISLLPIAMPTMPGDGQHGHLPAEPELRRSASHGGTFARSSNIGGGSSSQNLSDIHASELAGKTRVMRINEHHHQQQQQQPATDQQGAYPRRTRPSASLQSIEEKQKQPTIPANIKRPSEVYRELQQGHQQPMRRPSEVYRDQQMASSTSNRRRPSERLKEMQQQENQQQPMTSSSGMRPSQRYRAQQQQQYSHHQGDPSTHIPQFRPSSSSVNSIQPTPPGINLPYLRRAHSISNVEPNYYADNWVPTTLASGPSIIRFEHSSERNVDSDDEENEDAAHRRNPQYQYSAQEKIDRTASSLNDRSPRLDLGITDYLGFESSKYRLKK